MNGQLIPGLARSSIDHLFFMLAIVGLLALIYGFISNSIKRKHLKNYKENFFSKFRKNVLYGCILLISDIPYWCGNILSLIFIIGINILFNLQILYYFVPIWYTFIYFISRGMFDYILGKTPEKPYVKITDSIIPMGFQRVYRLLEVNLNSPFGKLKRRWAMPGGKFFQCYLWDTAFISLVWKYWDNEIASEILLNLLDNQSIDGKIPHYVSFFNKSDKIQPPLIAWAICNLNVDEIYLKQAYPKLKKFNQWLYENRRLENGLFFWMHSYESGIDNSPRFTDRSEKHKRDLTKIAAIDINAFMVLQNNSLMEIASRLKDNENNDIYNDEMKDFQRKNAELIDLIQKYLWDDGSGLYFDFDIQQEKRIEMNTIASFFPLIAGIPTEEQAKRLIKHLESSFEYNTKIPLPSVALNDKNFEKDTWRGPVWINTAYLIIKGLEKYQRYKLAGDIAFRIIEGVLQTWINEDSFYEFYDPERHDLRELTRKKGNLFKQITLGGKPVSNFVGWTGLINSLLIESVIGFNRQENAIRPCLPAELKGKKLILGFPLHNEEIELAYHDENNVTISVFDLPTNKIREYSCNLYQKINLK